MKKLVLVIIIFAFNTALATEYYVDKNAGGQNSGTSWTDAWQSFAAINWTSINPGDIIWISGGTSGKTYFERLTVNQDGTSNDPVIVRAATQSGHNGTVTIDGESVRLAVDMNSDYATIDGITIQGHAGSGDNGNGMINASSTTGVTITNCIIGPIVAHGGIFAKYTDDLTVTNCTIFADQTSTDQADLFYLQHGSNLLAENNIIYMDYNGSSHNDLMQIIDWDGGVIRNNYFTYITTKTTDVQGIYIAAESYGDWYIYNNYMYMDRGVTSNGAITFGQRSSGQVMTALIYSNTIVSINAGQGGLVRIVNGDAGDSEIKNNIIHNAEYNAQCISVEQGLNSLDNISNNLVYTSSTSNDIISVHGSKYTLSEYGRGHLNEDPLFTTDFSDLTLQSGSGAIDAGATLGSPYNTDYYGTSRPQGSDWDLGAYEYIDRGGNNPPNQPSNPYPANGAIDQPTSLTITWSCTDPDGDPLTYDVYFGTNSNPPVVSTNQSGTSFNPGTLNTNTTYYWKIVAKDNQGATTTGAVWNFLTVFEDIIPPEVVSAELLDSVTLNIIFSEALEQQGAQNPANYSITNGIDVLNASLSGAEVTLTTSDHSEGSYTVTVNNVTDLAGNLINPNSNSADYEYSGPGSNNLEKLQVVNVDADDWYLNYVPPKTIDGITYYVDPESRWGGAIPMPDEIIFDLGEEKTVGETRCSFYRWDQGRVYVYSVYSSTDGNNWDLCAENLSSASTEWTIHDFDMVNCRYIKLISISSNVSQWAGIHEVEIWGYGGTSSNNDPPQLPDKFYLSQNYPNPFNPSTTIEFTIPVSAEVLIEVFNSLGEKIEILANQEFDAGKHSVVFNKLNIPSGIYYYRILTPSFQQIKKMILLK